MISVSISIPLDACLEVVEELFDCQKSIRFFPIVDVAMVAFARLVIIAKDTNTGVDERHPIFVGVITARQTPGNLPDDYLGHETIPQIDTLAEDQDGLHVVKPSNTPWCCQSKQRSAAFVTFEALCADRPQTERFPGALSVLFGLYS